MQWCFHIFDAVTVVAINNHIFENHLPDSRLDDDGDGINHQSPESHQISTHFREKKIICCHHTCLMVINKTDAPNYAIDHLLLPSIIRAAVFV